MGREELVTLHAGESEPEAVPDIGNAAEAEPEPEPQPIEPEPGAPSRWVKPLSCYERRETTVVEGLRYG